MKAKISVCLLFFAFLLTSTVYAQDMRINYSYADISFSGTTATCKVVIPGNSNDDKISATIELLCGSQSIKTWNDSASGILNFKDTVSVTKGKTYDLVVEYTVNGKAQSSFSDSGTCN